jgi:4-alpha-glucanotransferase
MSRPHVEGASIRGLFGEGARTAGAKLFEQLGGEDLYLFRKNVSESFIETLGLPEDQTQTLMGFYHDRMFIETEPGLFAPAWFRGNSKAYASLSGAEKNTMDEIIGRYFRDSEDAWAKEGEALLRFMKDTTPMLPCAEDLGVVPDSVPAVLGSLGILGLKIPRWVKRYHEAGEPFIPPVEYPRLSVCAASVHDTTTVREWWETEANRAGLWQALGLSGPPPGDYSVKTAEKIFEGFLGAASALLVFQLQDFFALEESFRASRAADVRINVPGTVADPHWSYRMPFLLEELCAAESLKKKILTHVKKRSARHLA